MSEFPSLPLFTDAFLADTGHLDAQETGAYALLLMIAWRTQTCSLPDDDAKLARWARVDSRTWRRIKSTVMAFWSLADGNWTQKRLTKEREIVSKRAEVARQNGKHGGRPKSLETNDAENPAGYLWGTQKKAPNPISSEDSPSFGLSNERPQDGGATVLPFRSPEPSSDEDEFWKLAGSLEASGIARSRSGQLARLSDGNFTAALVQLRAVARAKNPATYLGAVIRGLREEAGEMPARPAARPFKPGSKEDLRARGEAW